MGYRVDIRKEVHDSVVNFIAVGEEYIVNDRTLQPAPKLLNFIKIRAIGWQKLQMKPGILLQ